MILFFDYDELDTLDSAYDDMLPGGDYTVVCGAGSPGLSRNYCGTQTPEVINLLCDNGLVADYHVQIGGNGLAVDIPFNKGTCEKKRNE